MNADWLITLTVLALTVALFFYAHWRAGQPAEPLKVRMLDYRYVQITCIVALLIVLAHLVTLYFGHPMTGGVNF